MLKKYLSLGVAVALAMTTTGAFATQNVVNITSLPVVIDQPGNYQLHFSNGNSDVVTYGDPAVIWIKASGVNLNLSGITVHTAGNGILIGPKPGEVTPIVDHVMITNGTIDEKTQSTYFGFIIGVTSTNVTLDQVNFTGTFGYNADYGSSSKISNGKISGLFTIISQGYLPVLSDGVPQLDPSFKAGYGAYSNLIVNQTGSWVPQWTGTAISVGFAMYPDGPNAFSNITAIGNVQLAPTDTYLNVQVMQGTLSGGINIGQ